ncbi:MAG: hypothetical protein FJ109_18315, partial [Deltaproteobacteria bacterium]|nr:hypothetical protein [Deltaproteobacteria bacterium]
MSRAPIALVLLLAACTYNPPPDVTLVAAKGKYFEVGDPIYLIFSEAVAEDSLSIRIWPGEEKYYTLEGERLPEVKPVVDSCSVGQSSCAGGTQVSLDAERTEATLVIPADKLGILDRPLVLEVEGRLADDSGHSRKVSVFFDFQIVAEIWDPYADVVETASQDVPGELDADVARPEPMGIHVGPYLFFAEFTSPIKLPQQFWSG